MSVMVAAIEALIAQYPIGEVADLLGVERTTLRRWRNKGYPELCRLTDLRQAIITQSNPPQNHQPKGANQ